MFNKLLILAGLVLTGVGINTLFGDVASNWFVAIVAVAAAFKLLPGRITFGALSVIFVKPVMLVFLGGMAFYNLAAGVGWVANTYAYGCVWLWGILFAAYSFLAFAPHSWIRAVVKPPIVAFQKMAFGFEYEGIEHYKAAGPRRLLCPTHPSFLDPFFIIAAVPDKISFAMHAATAEMPHFKFITRLGAPFADIYKVDMMNAMALKGMVADVKAGRTICIFPEGRIAFTGSLMKVQNGSTMIVNNADAVIIPIHVDGLQFSFANRMSGKLRRRAFPKVRVSFTDPVELEKKTGRAAREDIQLYDAMRSTMFETFGWKGQTLLGELFRSAQLHGYDHPVLENIDPVTEERITLDFKTVLIGTRVLEKKLKGTVNAGEVTGLMLPNAAGSAVAFFAMHRMGAVPAMLNFTMGPATVVSCCDTAGVQTVLTSRTFIELAAEKNNTLPGDIIKALEESGKKIVYLDDIRETVTTADKLSAALTYENWDSRIRKSTDPAVVLFTSGSEGVPKGVVLSHENLLSNRAQMKTMIGFTHQDTVLNAMPLFHSFGLLAGMILPVMEGVKTFMYPNPLDYKMIPMIAYDINATIMFGTDAFLQGYAKQAHSADFGAMRMIFAGAEKVKEETRRTYGEKFPMCGVFEGYGATECAPVIAVNTPMYNKNGSVGRLVAGLEARFDPVPGIEDGGRLFVRGPNVMLGYFRDTNPGVLEPLEDGWHDTGDIVACDEQGFLTIKGRAKRFAKVAGEMVALPVVDDLAARAWPDFNHASVAIEHETKGQQILLVTENPDADKKTLQEMVKAENLSPLNVPAKFMVVEEIPLLGSGKVDFGALNDLVAEKYGK